MRIDNLIQKLPDYYSSADHDLVMRAYRLAEEAHKGQMRASGEPYVSHCVAVAGILADMKVPSSFISGKKRVYVLQVRGESMIEEQIRDGDFVVVEQAENARNGEIVVALLDNGMATLKRFFKEATRIRLEPANAKMAPIFVKNVKIQGKVVGLIRKYYQN